MHVIFADIVTLLVLRRIYGPVMDRRSWQIRTNQQLYQLCGENDIVKFCKLSRLRWAGHVILQDMSYGRTCHTPGHVIRQDMSYTRTMMIYPGESSSVNQEESASEGDSGCVGKMEWRKM
jgi:hypothetical protein